MMRIRIPPKDCGVPPSKVKFKDPLLWGKSTSHDMYSSGDMYSNY
jgi:hypothetical protein